MNRTAEQVARTYHGAAIENYKRDGQVHPMMALIADGTAVYAMIAACDHVPSGGGRILGLLAGKVDPDFAVFVSETWMKAYTPGTAPDPDNFPKGELARMKDAGDPEVHTAVMVYVLDCRDYDRSHCIITVDRDGTLEESMDQPGRGWGLVTDILTQAHQAAMENPPPKEIPLGVLIKLIQEVGLANSVLLGLSDEGAADAG